ncbi:hypothetical protein PFICI_10339 [Pestalotiopsis fici W106-1]|uniref:BRCT domain-containing protein n=1 Tax=Pestalotiopsis fici (strain W106-1 / CGMCC3.15140) TaxID=1229662 RepID=W3WYU9_PESFW|nr:uncharacterized protein PFICI_10339 [Pestalotiopsis fici W106-1]ETS78277.1 hypothetical protein PFICI_10339 [Pestalotiopsis fici W106-1]
MAHPGAADADRLFSSCVFSFVESRDLPENLIQELSSQVSKHGGEVVDARRDKSLYLEKLTHIIANTSDFPQHTDATAMMIPVVRSTWISSSLGRNKLVQVRPFSPDPRMLFSDIVLTVADDVPPSDKESIIGCSMALGAQDSENITKLVTHVCALGMNNDKCRIVQSKNLKCKIVLPHWFDDCFRLGKRIDEGPYMLPDPEVFAAKPDDEVAVPASQHLEGATSARPQWMPFPTDSECVRPKLTVFEDKAVMLSWDLAISPRLKEIVQGLIESGGGEITDNVGNCDYFICQYREGEQYVKASKSGKDVGNLSWLYHLITHNTWTSPMRRLLHYPIPRDGIPGFKDLRITVSNYGGEARIYLENLITAAGATYTKTMKADNTHLITARNNSEKCEAARDWNINMTNHLWIEESYAKCEMQSLTVEKYTHFPPRTNLGEVIGQTPLDESRLRAMFYPGEPEKPSPTTSRKRKILDMAKENAYSDGPLEGVAIGRQARKEFDVMKDSEEDYAKKTTEEFGIPAPAKRRAVEAATPARGRHVLTGKENETPSTVSTGSRSAKAKAQQRLSEIAPDVALYDKEKKRGLKDGLWGGKRAADYIDREHLNRRSASSPTADEGEAVPVRTKRGAKKGSKPVLPEIDAKVILTGFKRWVNDKFKEDADRKKLRDLGIQVVSDGSQVDYLVAPQVVRTVKFLRNLSKGAKVLSSEWIEQCLDTGEVPPPEDYLLHDKENEKKFGFKLEASVERAIKNKGKLLWNVPIYCTSTIKNGTESYKAIADANGAIFLVYAARSGTTIKPTNPEDDEGGPEPVYLLSTASPEEKKLWPRFEAMAKAGNMEARVVASDWLLDVVMKQELTFDKKYLVNNFFS